MLGALGSTGAMLPVRSQYSGAPAQGLSAGAAEAAVSAAAVMTAPLVGRPIAVTGMALSFMAVHSVLGVIVWAASLPNPPISAIRSVPTLMGKRVGEMNLHARGLAGMMLSW